MQELDRRLRALRPAKKPIDPWRPIDVQQELELTPDGVLERCLTVFLAGRECPFTCIFCDLWRHTTDAVTPDGAIVEQIRQALDPSRREGAEAVETVKLYNASNFFDNKAVPVHDDDEILRLCAGIPRVVVECHASLVGKRCERYARRLGKSDSRLEVAIGFETVHPEALTKLNKKVTVQDLRAASTRLRAMDADLRAFVLIGVPFIDPGEQLAWALRSVEIALECGARLVSLIPLRGGESELRRLEQEGMWREPDLAMVEETFEAARALSPERVRLDTWDLERLASQRHPNEKSTRIETLRRMQVTLLEAGPPEVCPSQPQGMPA